MHLQKFKIHRYSPETRCHYSIPIICRITITSSLCETDGTHASELPRISCNHATLDWTHADWEIYPLFGLHIQSRISYDLPHRRYKLFLHVGAAGSAFKVRQASSYYCYHDGDKDAISRIQDVATSGCSRRRISVSVLRKDTRRAS